jgi:hypothetical protein
MATKKVKLTPTQQRKRFKEMAIEIGADVTEAGQERAFGKVGLKKPKKPAKTKGK